MIERAQPQTVRALAEAFGVADRLIEPLLATAATLELPLIAGWDAGTPEPALKLYVNASDHSVQVRRAMAEQLGWAAVGRMSAPPHLLAVNVSATTCQRKAYLQLRERAPDERDDRIERLVSKAARLVGGIVQSFDVDESDVRPRAFFLALRDDGEAASVLRELPGWNDQVVSAALPFPRGRCRSIGVALGDSALQHTAYFKPKALGEPLWSIDSLFVCATEHCEIGVHVSPRELGNPAYVSTARHAIAYRLRHGATDHHELQALMQWLQRHVEGLESRGEALVPPPTQPPAPWKLVSG